MSKSGRVKHFLKIFYCNKELEHKHTPKLNRYGHVCITNINSAY